MRPQYTPEQVAYFWSKVDKSGECWLWTASCGTGGYGQIGINNRALAAHRVAYEIAIGPIPPGMAVCHTCDVRACCRPSHLWLGTRRDNQADMAAKHRSAIGVRNGAARLTEQDVRDIRRIYANGGISQKRLAEQFGVTQVAVRMIVIGRNWRHVQDQ
jgi:hypothetical protein